MSRQKIRLDQIVANGVEGQVPTIVDGEVKYATPQTTGGGGSGGPGASVVLVTQAALQGASPHTFVGSSVQSGDLLIWVMATRNCVPASAGPQGGGWTKLWHVDTGTEEISAAWFKKAGVSDPGATMTWTHSSGSYVASAVVVYRGLLGEAVHWSAVNRSNRTPSIMGDPVGLLVCAWTNHTGPTPDGPALEQPDAALLTQDVLSLSADQEGVLIARRPTYQAAAAPSFRAKNSSDSAADYQACGAVVFR